ncbi:MAG: BatA domain-containing protein, partial [Victivallales bacterium]|nr:BatA domain-containing protein [Victivallales bacterium]
MTFLQPLLLWGLPLLAIPLIIHLMNRLRYRSVKWAAMIFLLKA